MTEKKRDPESYDRPQVEPIESENGPATTAAGGTGAQDGQTGAEWRPVEPERD